MSTRETITIDTKVQPLQPAVPASGESTHVEAWLLDLGLRAIQVEHCPIDDCEACYPARHGGQRAA
jgi:hypothetical protein